MLSFGWDMMLSFPKPSMIQRMILLYLEIYSGGRVVRVGCDEGRLSA